MSLAIICLCYMKSAAGASLLADYFADIGDLYIHTDAKADITPYAEAATRHPNITLADVRFPIFWGGFNTVKACIATIQQAIRTKDYARIAFITEDTIPLIAKSEFAARMKSDIEWIQIHPTGHPDWIARYERFFFLDSFATNPRTIVRLDRAWTPEMVDSVRRLGLLQQKGKAKINRMFDGGTWWSLTRPHIDKFLTTYHSDLHLRESFEFSAIPEEQYIHCVIGPLANAKALVFTDWTREPRPYVFRSMAAIKEAKTRDTPMLRKVAVGTSDIEDFVRDLARR